MPPLRLALVGTGIAARELHWPALRQLSDFYQIVAVCNRTRPKAEAFAELIGLDLANVTTDYAASAGAARRGRGQPARAAAG